MQAAVQKTAVNIDIFLEILSHLHPVSDRKTLRSLALVSRRFCDLALDVLWQQLDDVLPLFRLVEGRSWAIHDICCRMRPCFCAAMRKIPEADWTRFLAYARRVRVAGIGLPGYKGRMDNRTLLALVLRAGSCHVFPSLVSVEMTVSCLADFVLFAFLTGCLCTAPSVTGRIRQILLSHPTHGAFSLPILLDVNALRVAPVRKLVLAGKSYLLVCAVHRMGGLEQIEIKEGVYPHVWLKALGRAEKLRDVRFVADPRRLVDTCRILVGPAVLRNLERLDVSGYPPSLFRLFRNLSAPSLHSLTIRFLYGKDRNFWDNYRACLGALPASFRSTLRTLEIHSRFPDGTNTPAPAPFVDVFAALLRLSALENLTVNVCFPLVLSNKDACAVATAFPRLQVLACSWPLPPDEEDKDALSVAFLVHFLSKCPRLREFAIPRLVYRSSSPSGGDADTPLRDAPARGFKRLTFQYDVAL